MTRMSLRKIGKMSSKMRLAASEGRYIAQIGSLARRRNLRFPAIRQEEGFLELEADPLGSRMPRSRPDAMIRICSWKLGALPKELLEARKEGSSAQELPGAALEGAEAAQKRPERVPEKSEK